jgi:glycosyltransferase involved in cell wall biosynthesis
MSPEVSIVIPTRNRWPILSTHALPSALAQERVDVEIIVVDDASDDGTATGLAGLRDPRITIMRNEIPRRLPAARNVGAAVASGEWLAFLDDDDLWSPSKLRAQLDAAALTDASWVYARCVVVDAQKRPIELHPFPEPADLPVLLLGGNHVPGGGSNVIVRAEAFHSVGEFDEELRYFEDWDLWLRLVERELPAACPDIVVARVEHGQNMLFRDGVDPRVDFERILSKQSRVTDAQRLAVAEWVAHEHMRAGHNLRASALYARASVGHRSPGNLVAAVGAVFGRRGLAVASRFLVAARGGTHLEEAARPVPPLAPAWLASFASTPTDSDGSQLRTTPA